jgi:hypothetical protein
MVDMLADLAVQESKPQWRPWPEFLPTQTGSNVLSLQTPLDTAYMNDADIDMLRAADSDQVSGFALNEAGDHVLGTGLRLERHSVGQERHAPADRHHR